MLTGACHPCRLAAAATSTFTSRFAPLSARSARSTACNTARAGRALFRRVATGASSLPRGRVPVLRRILWWRHANHRAARTARDDRTGADPVSSARNFRGDQSPRVAAAAARDVARRRSHPALGRSTKFRQRAVARHGTLRKIRQRRGDRRAPEGGRRRISHAERRSDFQPTSPVARLL